ncbi:UvrD-helicase domain-containing protein [Candidatus Avelusimicrobium sp.]
MNDLKEDRFRARTLLGVNMVVEAGAGTGKTTSLIDRICFALLAQGIPATRLVALTFTEKAGAEIKTRLITKLQAVLRAVREEKSDPTLKDLKEHFHISTENIVSRAESALSQLDRSAIGTIHSFCADILRAYPLEAGLTPNAEIDKGPRGNAIFETQWNHFLDKELGENAPRPQEWKEILALVDLGQLSACARVLCSGKIGKYDFFAQKDKLIEIFEERAREASYMSTAFLDEKKKKMRVIERALEQAAERFEQAAQWLRTRQVAPAQESIKITDAPAGWEKEAFSQAKALCALATQVQPHIQERILKIYALLEGFVQEVRARYAAEGILSFDDLIVKTRDLLKNNIHVRKCVQDKYDIFFIDEFQDTDPVQGELLLLLAEKPGTTALSWEQVNLQPGKLFVVGDPKQSIYRFRGADITAYEMFTDLILRQGGEKAYLRQNFRSEREIIALANDVCFVVMKEKPAFQPPYEPIFTDKKELSGAAEMHLIGVDAQANAETYRQNQAHRAAQWIAQNVGKMTLRNGQKLQYKDIAILSRAGTQLHYYTDALRRSGIPFLVGEDKDFYKRQEIHDFLNILRVLDNPQDRIALVGVMRSPWGGMTDEEIYQASRADTLDFKKTGIYPHQERLFAWLRSFALRVGRQPLRRLLRALLQESFLRESCAIAYDGERSISTLEKLVPLAESYSLQRPATLGQFLAGVEKLMEEELSRLTALPEGETLNAVNLLTIHKSKGLEFPVVMLVDISKVESMNPDKRPEHLYSWRYQLNGLRIGKYADMNMAWLEEEQREHERCEDVRLLYVAITRAREKLLVFGNEASEEKTFAAMFAAAGRFAVAEEQKEHLGGEDGLALRYAPYIKPAEFLYRTSSSGLQEEDLPSFEAWKECLAERKNTYESALQQQKAKTPSIAYAVTDIAHLEAMEAGTLLHRALARFWQLPQQGLEQALDCVCRGEKEKYRDKAGELLQLYQNSALFAKLRRMQTLGVEMPFTQRTKDGLINGVIDLLLQDEKGTLWVVDYKTDMISLGEEARQAQKYVPQINAYRQAVQQLYPQTEIKAGIVFLRTRQMAVL